MKEALSDGNTQGCNAVTERVLTVLIHAKLTMLHDNIWDPTIDGLS